MGEQLLLNHKSRAGMDVSKCPGSVSSQSGAGYKAKFLGALDDLEKSASPQVRFPTLMEKLGQPKQWNMKSHYFCLAPLARGVTPMLALCTTLHSTMDPLYIEKLVDFLQLFSYNFYRKKLDFSIQKRVPRLGCLKKIYNKFYCHMSSSFIDFFSL